MERTSNRPTGYIGLAALLVQEAIQEVRAGQDIARVLDAATFLGSRWGETLAVGLGVDPDVWRDFCAEMWEEVAPQLKQLDEHQLPPAVRKLLKERGDELPDDIRASLRLPRATQLTLF